MPLRMFIAFMSLLLVDGIIVAQSPPAPDVAGTWRGAIETPGDPTTIEVVLNEAGGSWRGTIDIPAQGADDVPLDPITLEGDTLRFVIAGVPGELTFQGSLDEDRIEGTFTQSGQSFPFTLERAATGAAPPPETAATTVYEDPRERFTVPVPPGWTLEEREGYGVLTSPEGGITVHVLAVEGEDVEAALVDAWLQVRSDFGLSPGEAQELPATGGVERTVEVEFGPQDDENLVVGVGRLFQGTVYAMLVDADLAAVQRRGSQLGIIQSGFTIAGLEQESLAGTDANSLTDELLATFDAYVEETLARFGVPGTSVVVVQDGRIVFTSGYGTRNLETSEPMTPATRMLIGSATKTMTTLMMATLVDDGLLNWETPVTEIVPDFALADPDVSERITVEHLVCACTGVPRRDFELLFNAEALTAEAVVESLGDFELYTDFGEAFQYSNQMVAAAGYVAAVAAGGATDDLREGYVQAMRERVLEPIGMTYSTFAFEEVNTIEDRASPHGLTTGFTFEPIPIESERPIVPLAPAGGLWSNAIDLGRYLITQMSEGVEPAGRRIVAGANLTHTWEPQVQITAEQSYGLGWYVSDYRGLTLLHHGGNTSGFTTDLAFLPDVGIGIAVLTNGRATTPFNEAIRFRLFELAFDLEAAYDQQAMLLWQNTERALTSAVAGAAQRVDPEAVESYEATFVNAALGEITLSLDDGRLTLDAGAFTTELWPRPATDAATYVAVDQPLTGQAFRLEENPSGDPIVVFGQGASEYTFERVP